MGAFGVGLVGGCLLGKFFSLSTTLSIHYTFKSLSITLSNKPACPKYTNPCLSCAPVQFTPYT